MTSLLAVAGNRAVRNARSAAELIHRQRADRHTLAPPGAGAATGRAGELARLPEAECFRLLRTRHVGRMAYVARPDTPDVVPVNYTVDRDDRILVRSGYGPKLQAASRCARVAFEVDQIDEAARSGWSVVVHAWASVIPRHNRRLVSVAPPWAAGPRDEVICLEVRRIEGRRLT